MAATIAAVKQIPFLLNILRLPLLLPFWDDNIQSLPYISYKW
jgi:hypothetical protein